RTSRELAAWQGPRIAPERLAPADLVFFGAGGQVSHVGIYVGEGRFVHAPRTGGTVRLDRLDGAWWRQHYTGARRVLGAAGPGRIRYLPESPDQTCEALHAVLTEREPPAPPAPATTPPAPTLH